MAQCKGKNKDGTPCKNLVPNGQKYCHYHGRQRIWKNLSISAIVVGTIGVIGLIADLSGISGYSLRQVFFPEKMTGDFRVAVADFAVIGNSADTNMSTELAEGVYLKLKESLSEINKDFTITIWSPDKVGKIDGDSPEKRAESAEKIAKRIGADVLVYGLIDMSEPVWKITPEFYIVSDNFYEAEEITGQYQIGEIFSLVGQDSIARRIELSNKFDARAQAISKITVGLAYYSLRDYQKALETFQSAENISGWEENQGKVVLYLLEGKAALKVGEFDTSFSYLNKSTTIDPEYARPIVAMGSVYFAQAIQPFEKSKNPTDIDLALIDKAINEYNKALLAKHQPALSDIPSKVNFGLGQCYLMQVIAGNKTSLNPAIDKFEMVISAYENGNNPRLRGLAAESHARLGLIYDLSGHPLDAHHEYQQAADLLFDNPERQATYQERADKLTVNLTSTP